MKKADLMVSIGERLTDSVSQSYTFPAAPQPQRIEPSLPPQRAASSTA